MPPPDEPPAQNSLPDTRVLLIVTGLTLGGAERQVVDLAIRFALAGLRPAVMSMVSNGTLLKQQLLDCRIPLYELDMARGRPSLAGLRRAVQAVREYRPAIVHSHMYHSNVLARVLRLIAPVPVLICTAHNSDEGGPFEMFLYRATHWLASKTTNVSEIAARELERRGAAPPGGILGLPNGIDTQLFQRDRACRERVRSSLGLSPGTFLYFAAGRLSLQKDYVTLLQAMRRVTERAPNSRLFVAGCGDLEAPLKEQTRDLGLQDHVRWLGERHDVHELMNGADAFVLSSAFEGFGLVVAEAMATELPVAVTASCGPEEVVGDAGYVVPVRDPAALSSAMLEILALSPTAREQLGKRARRRIVENYSMDAAVGRWLSLYRSLLSQRAPKRDAVRQPAPE